MQTHFDVEVRLSVFLYKWTRFTLDLGCPIISEYNHHDWLYASSPSWQGVCLQKILGHE